MATTSDEVSLTEAYEEETDAPDGCFSAFFCCARSHYSRANDRLSLLQGELKETWWEDSFRRLKEFSELAAGPKWKTFVRRFNCHNGNRNRKPNFQYDPQSYALNFDDGADQQEHDERHGFSARFGSLSGKYTADFTHGMAGAQLNR